MKPPENAATWTQKNRLNFTAQEYLFASSVSVSALFLPVLVAARV